jgi:hypothetical protein
MFCNTSFSNPYFHSLVKMTKPFYGNKNDMTICDGQSVKFFLWFCFKRIYGKINQGSYNQA